MICQIKFMPFRSDGKYCSPRCQYQAQNLAGKARRAHPAPLPRHCGRCGSGFTPTPNNDKARFCSKACYQPEAKRQRRARLAAVVVERIDELAVYERDGWICQLCDLPIDRDASYPYPLSKSIDHRIPLALGGPHTFDNVQASHYLCNASKGHRVPKKVLLGTAV